jgi:hypothetical protein
LSLTGTPAQENIHHHYSSNIAALRSLAQDAQDKNGFAGNSEYRPVIAD